MKGELSVKKMITAMAAVLFAVGIAGWAQAAVIDFNGVDNTAGDVFINPYSEDGFTLSNSGGDSNAGLFWYRYGSDNADPDGATFSHNYLSSTTTLTKDGGGTFDFNSIYLGDVYNAAMGGDVRFDFSTGPSVTVSLDSLVGLQKFTFDRTGVDYVSWIPLTTHGPWLQLDDITVNGGGTVPEPTTMLLLGLGLMGLAGVRRKMTK
jgi:hypothetical protein